jgi:hypothetical protein
LKTIFGLQPPIALQAPQPEKRTGERMRMESAGIAEWRLKERYLKCSSDKIALQAPQPEERTGERMRMESAGIAILL